MNKYLFLLAGALASASIASATPARKGVRTFSQPDGTQIQLSLVGDERAHVYLTPEGLPVASTERGFFYLDAPAFEGGAPVVTNAQVGINPAPAVNKAAVFEAIQSRRAIQNIQRIPAAETMKDGQVSTKGSTKSVVILVEYQDVKFKTSDPLTYFTDFMSQKGFKKDGNYGSCLDFFTASSRGQFTPDFKVYGPVTLSYNRSYYGGNDMYGQDKAPEEMAVEALRALDDEVDFSQFDTTGDGFIDNVTIIYAGEGEADFGSDDCVWPHQWQLYTYGRKNVVVDGVRADRYIALNEWGRNKPSGIATFCHEFSHTLGLPDLYPTDYNHSESPGDWSVMDSAVYLNDGRTPPVHSAYEAYCLGWVEPEPITGAMNGSLDASFSGQSYLIDVPDYPKEFFIFENRSKEGWDQYLPSEGMLVWHIDFNKTIWENNSVNNSRAHQRIDLVEADGRPGDSTNANDVFPGRNGQYDELTYYSNPAALEPWYAEDLELPITEITRNAESGIVTFKVCGGVADINAVEAKPVEGETSTSVLAVWDASADAEAYELNVYNVTNDEYEPGLRCLRVEPTAAETSRAGTISYTITGLTPGCDYTYAVRVVGENARSEFSAPVAFKTAAEEENGIKDINIDATPEGPDAFFDLRGIRIQNPQPGGIYIRRSGSKVEKVVIL